MEWTQALTDQELIDECLKIANARYIDQPISRTILITELVIRFVRLLNKRG